MAVAEAAPHSTQAEASVVGKMLASPTVVGEVIGTQLHPDDFHTPAYRAIYHEIVASYYADDPIDVLTIGEMCAKTLSRTWKCDEAQAVAQVQALAAGQASFAGDATDHAKIVKRDADFRSLLELAATIERGVATEDRAPDELAGEAAEVAMKIATSALLTHDLVTYEDLGRNFIAHQRKLMAARAAGVELGAYFDLKFVDDYIRGLLPTELMILAGDPGAGKALALDTPIPTPGGWTTMRDLEPGHEVLAPTGLPVAVTAITPVQIARPCFRVVFSDGESIVADAEHLWCTSTRPERRDRLEPALRTTAEIARTLTLSDGQVEATRLNHSIQVCEALELPEGDLRADPYVLGCWLGDGRSDTAGFTCAEPELVANMEDCGYDVAPREGLQWLILGLGDQLADLGLLGEKRIPPEYLRASVGQREALLGGLIDTDGHVSTRGGVEISVMDPGLAGDVYELAISLGLKATMRKSRAMLDGRFAGWRYRICWRSARNFARLSRKQIGELPARTAMWQRRYVRAVLPVPSVPVRCIEVEGGMYLAGRGMIPTHNSAVAWRMAQNFAERQAKRPEREQVGTLVLSLEMSEEPSSTRLAQAITGIDGGKLREGKTSSGDLSDIRDAWAERRNVPLYFNFSKSMRAAQLRAVVVEAVRRYNVGLVVVDHFRYFDMDGRFASKLEEEEEKARFLAQDVAGALNVAVICLAHTTKGVNTEDKRPTLEHLRGGQMVAAHADCVGMVYRPIKHATQTQIEENTVRRTDAELLWVKNRNGLESTGRFKFDPSRMVVE